MARIRTIKPEFFKHSGLYDAERETSLPLRLAFAGLWVCADRAGRFKWRPRELKLEALPYDDVDFERVMDALATRGFVVRYASGDDEFGYIPSWKHHQFINNKEPQSSIPNPPINQHIDASATREQREEDANETRGVKEGKGKGREGERKGQDALRDGVVEEIVCAHPKSVARKLEPSQVRQCDSTAVLEAIQAEEHSAGIGKGEAAEGLLAIMRTFADAIPREEWRFLKDVAEFFRSFDYRRYPSEFCRGKPKEPTLGNDPTPAVPMSDEQRAYWTKRARERQAKGLLLDDWEKRYRNGATT